MDNEILRALSVALVPVMIYLCLKNPYHNPGSVSLAGAIWFTLQCYALVALIAGAGIVVGQAMR